MKLTYTISLICFLLLGFMVQSNGQNLTDQEKALAVKQVDSIFHSMIKLAEKLDFDALSQGVYDGNHAGFVTNGTYFPTYESLIDRVKANAQGLSQQSITVQKENIAVLSESIVLLTATGETKVDVSSGNSFIANFFWTFVYQKIDNQWKVIQSHQSGSR